MDKVAFLFSGQGDQFSGMGKDLYLSYKEAKEAFDLFDSLREGTKSQCFEGSDLELNKTENTQPCLFAMEIAAAKVLESFGCVADGVAGFSLGEVVAAYYSGLFDLETGFKLVQERGKIMQKQSEKTKACMAAVLKLSEADVKKICMEFENIFPVNFNCPGQVTVSGLEEEMILFYEKVQAQGGRAIPLKVSGAFHSPFMREASDSFRCLLEKVKLGNCKIDLYSNMTAKKYTDDAILLLSEQISHPVLWERLIKNMIADGYKTFIEIGPGRTLTNMVKKIDSSVSCCTYSQILEEKTNA
ncbi:MAG: ACP S-malonyltransferase [Sphaerochaetaceae bacterium]|mgnify:CR=1 FL=1|nr:ACP S-malonyltransferase [Sphaerochaetaceae bacterium]